MIARGKRRPASANKRGRSVQVTPRKSVAEPKKEASRPGEADQAKTVPVGPSEFRIGFYVHDVSRMRRTLFDHEMKPLGITRSQWWVLAQLSRAEGHSDDEGMLQTDLARILDAGKVTIGGLIDRLELSGFVQRCPDRIDRRAKRIVITARGRQVLNQMVKVGRRLNLSILDGISQKDIVAAEKVLARMKANIRNTLAPLKLNGDSDMD